MITTVDFLVEGYIQKKHGWAVAEQFLNTYNGESFEEQNYNALAYIRESVRDVLSSDILNEKAHDQLQTYCNDLEQYMAEMD